MEASGQVAGTVQCFEVWTSLVCNAVCSCYVILFSQKVLIFRSCLSKIARNEMGCRKILFLCCVCWHLAVPIMCLLKCRQCYHKIDEFFSFWFCALDITGIDERIRVKRLWFSSPLIVRKEDFVQLLYCLFCFSWQHKKITMVVILFGLHNWNIFP